jgi:pyrroline-5-carboxylate reductase
MPAPRGPLLLVGGGKMGSALLEGWLKAGLPAAETWAVEPDGDRATGLRGRFPVHVIDGPARLPQGLQPRTLVAAVKPQLLDAALAPYRELTGPDTLILSIAAGKTIATFEALFGPVPIVRAMPNTPAAVGRGASVLCANAGVDPARRAEAEQLLAAVGETAWVEDESLMHAVTAMSGGGPAYVYLLIETMAAAGARLGLPAELAMRLARATVIGSGELASRNDAPAARLRQDVTSPGGTTQAALSVLMAADGIQPLFDRALAAAAQRSRELG